MAVYYVSISLLTGFGYFFTGKKQSQKQNACYLAFAFLLFSFLASFRYAIGFDYFSYRNIYHMVIPWSFQDIFLYHRSEPFYYLVCKLFSLAGCPFPVFLMFINLFLMAADMHFISRNSKIPWVSVYLYLTLQFLAYNMNLIRQSIAAAFFLLAYPYLKNRKLLPYTVLIFLGGLFHNSLWFVWPLYFVLPRKHSKPCLGFLLGAACLTYVFFDPIFRFLAPVLPARYANYQGSYFWSANGFEYILLPAVYCLLIYLFRNRIKDQQRRSIYLNSALYQFLINLFITKHFILERFAIYPFVFSLLAIPEIIDSYRKDGLSSASETAGKSYWLDNLSSASETAGKSHQKTGTLALTYRRVLFLFLLFGLAWFLFAAAEGFHRVYPYVSLLDMSLSQPDGALLP